MKNGLLLGAAIAATLVACTPGGQRNDTAATNDVVAADNMVAADAANDMAAVPANAAAAAPSVTYDCKPAMGLSVVYDNAAGPDGQAVVTLDRKTFRLDHVQSGSGARYFTANGRAPGASLVWWNKGTDGTLSEGKSDNPDAEEKTLASCTQRG